MELGRNPATFLLFRQSHLGREGPQALLRTRQFLGPLSNALLQIRCPLPQLFFRRFTFSDVDTGPGHILRTAILPQRNGLPPLVHPSYAPVRQHDPEFSFEIYGCLPTWFARTKQRPAVVRMDRM